MNYTALRASAKNQGLIFRALDKPDPNLIQATLKKKKKFIINIIYYIYVYIFNFFFSIWPGAVVDDHF